MAELGQGKTTGHQGDRPPDGAQAKGRSPLVAALPAALGAGAVGFVLALLAFSGGKEEKPVRNETPAAEGASHVVVVVPEPTPPDEEREPGEEKEPEEAPPEQPEKAGEPSEAADPLKERAEEAKKVLEEARKRMESLSDPDERMSALASVRRSVEATPAEQDLKLLIAEEVAGAREAASSADRAELQEWKGRWKSPELIKMLNEVLGRAEKRYAERRRRALEEAEQAALALAKAGKAEEAKAKIEPFVSDAIPEIAERAGKSAARLERLAEQAGKRLEEAGVRAAYDLWKGLADKVARFDIEGAKQALRRAEAGSPRPPQENILRAKEEIRFAEEVRGRALSRLVRGGEKVPYSRPGARGKPVKVQIVKTDGRSLQLRMVRRGASFEFDGDVEGIEAGALLAAAGLYKPDRREDLARFRLLSGELKSAASLIKWLPEGALRGRLLARLELLKTGHDRFYVPKAPQKLRVSLVGEIGADGKVGPGVTSVDARLEWEDRSHNESGFRIERRLGDSGEFVRLADVPADATEHLDRGLGLGETYVYRVVARASGGDSPPTGPVSVRTPLWREVNLVRNGDFEKGTLEGWHGWDWPKGRNVGASEVATVVSSGAHGGRHAAKIVGQREIRQTLRVQPDAVYRILGWIKILSVQGEDWGSFKIQVDNKDWKGNAKREIAKAEVKLNEWVKLEFTFAPTTDQIYLQVGLHSGAKMTMEALVDDIWVVRAK